MKTSAGILAFVLALGVSAGAQDDKYKPEKGEEKELTPEQAMKLLKEAQDLMLRSEELLNDSSRGKALEGEAEILKKLEELLKDDPAPAQKKILELIRRLIERTEKKQQETIEKLSEVIRRAKSQSSSPSSGDPKDPKEKDPKKEQSKKPKNSSDPAKDPYNPDRTDPPSKFRSEADRTGAWGDLPARMRDAILHGSRDIDDYPAEYREMIKEYMKSLQNEK